MMGLIINNDIVKYIERPLEITGSVRRTDGFNIPLDEIKVIGVRAIVLIDDEDFIVSLIDKNKNEFKFSSLEFETSAGKFLEEKFNISLNKLWGSFTYKQHINGATRILYPQELQGKPLYKKMFDSLDALINALNIFTEPFKGILTDEVKSFIYKINQK